MSCGCYGRKLKSIYANSTNYPPSHKLSLSPFYKIRVGLIHKCYKEKHPSYSNFGGIGISFCDLWRNSAKDMYEWAISNNWEKGDVICLKSGEKEFNPENCYIIKESAFRSEVGEKGGYQVTYNGETHSVSKWAKLLDVSPCSLRKKLNSNPCIDEVFSSKFRKMFIANDPDLIKKILTLYESGKSQTEISNILNIFPQNIRYHLLKNNVVLRKNENRRLKKSDVSNEKILDLYEKKYSINKIAKIVGLSGTSIKKRLNRLSENHKNVQG